MSLDGAAEFGREVPDDFSNAAALTGPRQFEGTLKCWINSRRDVTCLASACLLPAVDQRLDRELTPWSAAIACTFGPHPFCNHSFAVRHLRLLSQSVHSVDYRLGVFAILFAILGGFLVIVDLGETPWVFENLRPELVCFAPLVVWLLGRRVHVWPQRR